VEPVRLTEPVRAGSAEPWCSREDERASGIVPESLECVSLDGRALMDVPAENELRSDGCEGA
jgi:hypothetical protein